MTLHQFSIKNLHFYPGCQARLGEPSALLNLHWQGQAAVSVTPEALSARLRPWFAGSGLPDFFTDVRDFLLADAEPFDLGAAFAALAAIMQLLAYQPVGRAQVLSRGEDRVQVAIPWREQEVFKGAVKFALSWLMRLSGAEMAVAEVAEDHSFTQWLQNLRLYGLSPNSLSFVRAARRRRLPVQVFSEGVIQLGWGVGQLRLEGCFTDRTGNLATRLVRNKYTANKALARNGVPVPPTRLVSDLAGALKAATELVWPVVLKPVARDQGEGVTPGIKDENQLQRALAAIHALGDKSALLEKHVAGDDYRLLVAGGKLIVATRRRPGGVEGDGRQTVSELLVQVNGDPRRGQQKRSLLKNLILDDEALSLLAEQGLQTGSVPLAGHFVCLRRTANISTGGTAEDVTGIIHPDNKALAERVARIVGLDVAGVDFLTPDISRPWHEVGGYICEVNACPGLRPHWLADPERDLNGEILDWLIRERGGRIPTAAITGSRGTTLVARLLHHLWQCSGKQAGASTTQGVWIGSERILPKNLSGYPGGSIILNDPAVEVAIMEMSSPVLLQYGHPCDIYDVVALLDLQDEPLEASGRKASGRTPFTVDLQIQIQALARARQAVVLNVDALPSLEALPVRIVAPRRLLVSRSPEPAPVQAHLRRGGEIVTLTTSADQLWITLVRGQKGQLVLPVNELDLPPEGQNQDYLVKVMFAVALAWAQGLDMQIVRSGLRSYAG
ncbi:MAG: cyanophycin synthetase [Deltaproteobacteria bacterium]|nr:cyanophycin synthetase [Deltaproteobacteria bacterium]